MLVTQLAKREGLKVNEIIRNWSIYRFFDFLDASLDSGNKSRCFIIGKFLDLMFTIYRVFILGRNFTVPEAGLGFHGRNCNLRNELGSCLGGAGLALPGRKLHRWPGEKLCDRTRSGASQRSRLPKHDKVCIFDPMISWYRINLLDAWSLGIADLVMELRFLGRVLMISVVLVSLRFDFGEREKGEKGLLIGYLRGTGLAGQAADKEVA